MTRPVGARDKRKRNRRTKQLVQGAALIGLSALGYRKRSVLTKGINYLKQSRKKVIKEIVEDTPKVPIKLEPKPIPLDLKPKPKPVDITPKPKSTKLDKQQRSIAIYKMLTDKGLLQEQKPEFLTDSLREKGFRFRIKMKDDIRQEYSQAMKEFYTQRKTKAQSISSIPNRRKFLRSTLYDGYVDPKTKKRKNMDSRYKIVEGLRITRDKVGRLPTRQDRIKLVGFSKY